MLNEKTTLIPNIINKKTMMAGLILLGVGANFLKEIVLSYYYGASHLIDQFRVASYLPYALFQSLGSVLVALFLPRAIPPLS